MTLNKTLDCHPAQRPASRLHVTDYDQLGQVALLLVTRGATDKQSFLVHASTHEIKKGLL